MQRLLLTLTTVFLLILPAWQSHAAIDFTPTVTRYFSEGAEYTNISFRDEKKIVTITLPRLWTSRGDSARLQLAPPSPTFAEGVIQAVPAKGPIRFDEATIKSLEQQVLAGLPAGSQGGSIVSEQENPVILCQNLSYEIVVSYQVLGQIFYRSVIFVACADQQLVFRFAAPKAVFGNLNKSFRQSICSWQWAEPSAAVLAQQ